MATKLIKAALIAVLIALAVTPAVAPQTVHAAPSGVPTAASASDLIAAINALRASKGAPPLIEDPSLMRSAQGHSDYQASIGTYTHFGPGGSTPTSRGVAAGFGGGSSVFVSENVAYQVNAMPLDTIIYTVWADALHWGTMVSPKYTHAGAGVTVNGPFTYYTFDAGQIIGKASDAVSSNSSSSQVQAQPLPTATVQLVAPVITSTTRPDGSVYHLVQFGQTLITIAQAYGLTVAGLQKLNNLGTGSTIFEGQTLLIRGTSGPTTVPSNTPIPPTPTRTPPNTRTPTLPPSATPLPSLTPTPTAKPLIPDLSTMDNKTIGEVILGVSVVGLLLVLVSLFIRKKPN